MQDLIKKYRRHVRGVQDKHTENIFIDEVNKIKEKNVYRS